MADVEAVSSSGRVVVVLRLLLYEPVVGGVVDAPETQGRTKMVSLRRVVVHDIEDDLDPRCMKRVDHPLELVDLLAAVSAARVLVVRRKKADRVVAPVIAKPLVDEAMVVDELVHRHELHRGHAKRQQVLHDRWMREARVGAALLLGHVRMALGHALDVRLVDHRLVKWGVRPPVASPVEVGVLHDGTEHVRRAVHLVD